MIDPNPDHLQFWLNAGLGVSIAVGAAFVSGVYIAAVQIVRFFRDR